MKAARLYVVATPIGNLDDITLRALEVLASANVVAAEDTRRTRILMTRHGLDKPLTVLQEHNEEQKAPRLVERMTQGESVALVSDAGTPLLSDPGFRLVQLAAEAGIEVVAVPGPSSVTAALSISGLATDRFVFEGFLPARRAGRRKRLAELSREPRTLVIFESSHRVVESLSDLCDELGPERRIALCREMTKAFETVLRGTATDVLERVQGDEDQRKGEFVLVVAGCGENGDESLEAALRPARALQEYLPASQAARVAAKIHGVPRRDLYSALGQDEKRGQSPFL
jgi:16S rRNA (cytidine1402-2'-O)-methyltransferase